MQAHHIDPLSQGGPDTEENQTGICANHHLVGIHAGYMRVRGRAPDRLVWEVGGRVFTGGARKAGPPALDARVGPLAIP